MSERKSSINATCPKCGERLKRVYVSNYINEEDKVRWGCTDFHICLDCEKMFRVEVKVKEAK